MNLLYFGLQNRLNQILSNSVKEGALFKEKKVKKIEIQSICWWWEAFTEQIWPDRIWRDTLYVGINSLSKDIAFGSNQPVYQ